MKATLIYGQEGSGKSSLIYKMCAESRKKGSSAVLIVPDQYTHQTELDLIEALGGLGLSDTEVFSFKRLSHRLKLLYGGASVIMINDEGRTLLVNAIINRIRSDEDTALLKNAAQTDISSDMAHLISRLKQYDITPEMLEGSAIDGEKFSHTRAKLLEAAKVYREYLKVSNELDGRAFTDSEDDMALLCRNIEQSEIFKNTDIYIDGFDDFVRPELKVVESLVRYARSVTISLPCKLNVRFGRGLLFYRQKKMMLAVEAMLGKLGVTPYKINIGDESDKNSGEDAFVQAQSRRVPELAHLEKNIFASPQAYSLPIENITLVTEQSLRAQAEHTADRIHALVRDCGMRYNEIAVVCGDAAGSQKVLANAFEKRDIPYFMDIQRNIRSNAIVGFVLGLLDVACKDRGTHSVLSLLRCGLLMNGYKKDEDLPFDFTEVAYLEKYCIAYYVNGKDWKSDFKYGSSYYDLDRLNKTRQRAMYYIEPFEEAMANARTASDIANVLEGYIEQMGIGDIVNNKVVRLLEENKNEEASEYSTVYNLITELFVQIKVFMGDVQLSVEEFCNIIKRALENARMNIIPVCLDQVSVLDKARTTSKHIKAMFVIGAENITTGEESGIFNSTELELLKGLDIDLGADKNNSIGDTQYYIYKTLAKPTHMLYISSVVNRSEESSGAPVLCEGVKNAFGKALAVTKNGKLPYLLNEMDNIASCEDAMLFRKTTLENKLAVDNQADIDALDEWLRQHGSTRYSILARAVEQGEATVVNQVEENVPGEIMLRSNRDEYTVDISRLERYVRCPYAYFARYCLNIKPEGKGRVSALDTGNIIHDMLDGFANTVLCDNDATENDVKEYIEENFSRITLEYNAKINASGENEYVLKRIKNILTRLMNTMLENSKLGNTRYYATELQFDDRFIKNGSMPALRCVAENGDEFKITGKIDSVEFAEIDGKKHWIINDYKTGYKPTASEIAKSSSLQLPIYMLAMLENTEDSKPGAMFYTEVKDNIVTSGTLERAKLTAEEYNEKRYGRSGIVADNQKLMMSIDRTACNEKQEYDISTSVTVKSKSEVARLAPEELEKILENAENKAGTIFCDIKSGKISKDPQKMSDCEGCEYRRLCSYVREYETPDEGYGEGDE